MAKKKEKVPVKTGRKRGRLRKIDKEIKAEKPEVSPEKEEKKTPETIIPEIHYKEEIVILGKRVKRLNDERDTDLQFHCQVDDGTTAHFDKELFK